MAVGEPVTPEGLRRLQEMIAPPYYAYIATVEEDGWPHVTPLFCEYVDGELVMSTVAGYAKLRNLRQDNRLALSFALPRGSGSLMVQGRARLTQENVHEVTRQLYARYSPPELMAELMISAFKKPRVLIYVKPERIVWPMPRYYSAELRAKLRRAS